jgi:hypothetical protein
MTSGLTTKSPEHAPGLFHSQSEARSSPKTEGKPGIVRNFLAYEADKERTIESVRKRAPVYDGELAKAVAEARSRQF